MTNIGIIFTKEDAKNGRFIMFARKIEDWIDSPTSNFIFSDEHPVISRYLNRLQYRKCIMYHIGDTPKHNIGKYSTKGNFLSYSEIYASIREAADVVIDVDSI